MTDRQRQALASSLAGDPVHAVPALAWSR
jgi:hypothetical protein